MLKQRIITAVLMLAILIPSVFYSEPWLFGIVALILIAAAGWEWARLNQYEPLIAQLVGGTCALFCLASWYLGVLSFQLSLLWILCGSAWVVLGAWLLHGGVNAWSRVPRLLRLVGGIFALWVAWLAVTKARMVGINFLFSILVLVWVADVFAYFAGRLLGGRFFSRKLAPSISPGKTWEGVFGGLVGVVVCAFVWQRWSGLGAFEHPSLYNRLYAIGPVFMVLAVVFLAAMSVVGDLVESLFKRSAGVKDSSGLLPGHGGVLDRIDALLPILPLAMMLSAI
jgi:phosphatidate cytidylyltransferase